MAERKWSCFYCPAQFDTLIELQDHRPLHDTTDAESDMSDKTDINDCYYSSQESDYEAAKVREMSEDEGTEVDTVSDLVLDNDQRDKDFEMEEMESEEEVPMRKKKKSILRSKKARNVKRNVKNKEDDVKGKVRSKETEFNKDKGFEMEESKSEEEASKRKKKKSNFRSKKEGDANGKVESKFEEVKGNVNNEEGHDKGKARSNETDFNQDKRFEMEESESEEEVGKSRNTKSKIPSSRPMSDVNMRLKIAKVRNFN